MTGVGRKLGMAAVLLAAAAGTAWGVSPEDGCEASKNKEAGKYASCRQSAEEPGARTRAPQTSCATTGPTRWTARS